MFAFYFVAVAAASWLILHSYNELHGLPCFVQNMNQILASLLCGHKNSNSLIMVDYKNIHQHMIEVGKSQEDSK